MKKRIYIAGKMSGLPDYNRPAFNKVAKRIRGYGYEVFNPAEVKIIDGTRENHYQEGSWGDYMRRDIAELMSCDMVVALPGWTSSPGACIEHGLCRDLSIPWVELAAFEADQITDAEAEQIVHNLQA